MRRIRRIILLFIAALAIAVGFAVFVLYQWLNQDPPPLAQTAGELIFISDRDGDWDIYLLDTAGEIHNLTMGSSAHEYFPSFTFEGDHISLFSTEPGWVTPARVKPDGSNFETQDMVAAVLTIVAEGQTNWDPVWAPDGERIAWAKLQPGIPPQVNLFVADLAGSNREQVTDQSGLVGMHAWAPDGTQLVYTTTAGGEVTHTYVVDVAKGEITQLTQNDASNYGPFWSVDGRQILVVFHLPETLLAGKLAIQVMNADGSDLHPLGADEVFTGDLTFAPDGDTVAYVSNESGYWHIYLMDADGSNIRQITTGESNNLYPVWRPIPAQDENKEIRE